MYSLCSSWEFTPRWSDAFARGEEECERVSLPHNTSPLPLHYCSPADYEGVFGYRRILNILPQYAGKRIFLQFDGAAHDAVVYLNGSELGRHSGGYTAFRFEITDNARPGENLLAVRLDSRESLDIPPFGHVIDYLTYSGLYREAWLDVRPRNFIEDVFVTTPDLSTARVSVRLSQPSALLLQVLDGGRVLTEALSEGESSLFVAEAEPWSPDSPKLYTLRAILSSEDDGEDIVDTMFGFRTAVFKADGFYLNGERLFMRGLNRHQCWPYFGYAAPESLQREDARILKRELAVNTVRTSHYPQSQYFIDECDRLGLLVFTEIPGWQHLGGEKWQTHVLENVREMVLQYRNHPSIVLWGVRVNESQDNDALYERTNAICRELDPSRATSGVRFLKKSSLLEDVYSFNDFSHCGTNRGVKKKRSVSPDMGKALLISEHNGHMFPTKSFDTWSRRQEQALRHARVLNDAMAGGEHAGCIGWCMFDYATHKDFGSGDRICYHGVMDAFRNPKPAAFLYASQGDSPVLELSTSMDIGDYPAGNKGDTYIFTNADEVRLYKNGSYVAAFSGSDYSALPRGPVRITDTIGRLLESEEGFDRRKALALADCLNAAGRYGHENMPLKYLLKMAIIMLRYKFTMADAVRLYGKYVGNWGSESTVWRFDAVKDGELVASRTLAPNCALRLELKVSSTHLRERVSYDMAAVRVRILNAYGNPAPYALIPIAFSIEGDAELCGPPLVTAEGGMCGCYVRSLGRSGRAKLSVSNPQTGSAELEFSISTEGALYV